MIVLITPTGGRQKQFDLCCTWMKKQTYTGKVLWIIIDDCIPATTLEIPKFPDNWNILVKRPVEVWEPGMNTQGRNLKIGIDVVKRIPENQVEAIFIIEDDDYYSAVYLEKMVQKLKGYHLAGERFTIYYHVGVNKYHGAYNRRHASLFQIAFTPAVIPNIERYYDQLYIDMKFCISVTSKNLFARENLAIGIKGQPGRMGIGIGHKETGYILEDTEYNKLKELIGQDYTYYERQ